MYFVYYKTYFNLFNLCAVKKIMFKFHSSQEILFFIRLLQIVFIQCDQLWCVSIIIHVEQTDNGLSTNEVRYSLKSCTASSIILKTINENLKQQYKITYYNI